MFDEMIKEYLTHLLSFSGGKENSTRGLTENFYNLSSLFHTDSFSMRELSGCDENSANYIRLVAALTSRRITDKFKNGKKYLQNELEEYIVGLFFGLAVETVYLILLDEDDRLISAEYLGDGTVNASGFLPRKLLDIVLRKNAKKVILAHNHPCGKTACSKNDIATTYVAKTVLRDAGVALLNHYIVSGLDIEDCLPSVTATGEDSERYLNVSASKAVDN